MSPLQFGTALRRWLHGLSERTATDPPDGQLLERFVGQRDETAFEMLVHRHGPLVLGVCRNVLRDIHDAEDAFQATFLVLACRAGAIRRTQSVASFLYGTACRIARRLRAQNARRHALHQQAANRLPNPSAPDSDDRDAQRLLHEELNRLPRKYRDVLVLCYLQSKTSEQAARELGYPPGSMSRHLSRARELLRERLLGRGVGVLAALVGPALAEQASAAVPPALLHGTLETVRRHAMAALLAGSAPPVPVVLAQGVLRAAWISRLTIATMVLAAGTLVAGAGLLAWPTSAPSPEAKTPAAPPDTARTTAQPRLDLYGDPLPDGVLTRMGTERLRHPLAQRLVFAADGKTLLSTGQDHTIRFWDRATGQLKRLQRLPPLHLVMAFSPDGKTLAQSGKEQTQALSGEAHLHLWDIAEAREIQRIPAGKFTGDNRLHALEYSPDGKTLAAAYNRDGTIRLWDARGGKERGRYKLEHVQTLALSPDGKILAASGDKRLVLWDVAAGKELHAITGPNAACYSLAFSPDGKLLAGAAFRAVVFWETATGKEHAVLPLGPAVCGTSNSVVAFSPDGKTVAVRHNNDLVLWDRATRKEEKRLHGPYAASWYYWYYDPAQLCFSPDGNQLASLRSGAIVLWDVATGKQIQERPSHLAAADSVAFSPDGKLLASAAGGDQTVRLWDARTGEQLHVWPMPHGRIWQLIFTPDGRGVIAVGFNGDCRMWDVRRGEQRHIFRLPPVPKGESEMLTTAHLSPSSKRLTALSLRTEGQGKNKRYLTTWDVATGERIERRMYAFVSQILLGKETFSPDGKLVTTMTPKGLMIYDIAADRPLRHLTVYGRPAFSPDGKVFAFGDSSSAPIQLMDLASGENLLSLPAGDGWQRDFTRDGRYLVTAGDKDLRLWELASGKEVLPRRILPTGHVASVTSSSFSGGLALAPDGRSVATGLTDTNILIWDLAPATRQKRQLTAADLDRLWADLAGQDAPRAYQAAGTLIADPERTVPFLKRQLRPIAEDAPRIRRLIADLDSEKFAVREAAWKELEKMDDAAHAVLRQALPKASSLEQRRRIQALLSVPWVVRSPEKLRQIRAVMVLEQIGGGEARRLLQRLAEGTAGARQTREAKAALRRLLPERGASAP